MMVVAAVIERDGRILIGQRRSTDPHPLKWEFPGGKVEPGEAAEDALMRELREELGLEVVVGGEITRYYYRYPHKPAIELIFYSIAEFDTEPLNLAFERIVWEAPENLGTYDFLDGDVEFLRLLSLERPRI
jgi:8-oxo-dGTP diphosphatase